MSMHIDVSNQVRHIIALHVALSIGAGGLGGVAFVSRFPEAYCERMGLPRGTFDVVGCSHSIMHVCVALGAWFTFRGQRLWEGAQMHTQCT